MNDTKVCPHCKTSKVKSEFYSRRGGEGLSPYCKDCSALQTKSRQQALKRECIRYKGGKCQQCGYDKCQAALEFHHIDPSTKEFSLGKFKCSSLEKVREELGKCVLLCANCHREAHYNQVNEWKNSISEKVNEPSVELDSYQNPRENIVSKYPSIEELKGLVWVYPVTHLAKVYGVSSVALGKFLKTRGLSTPPRGYWAKVKKRETLKLHSIGTAF